MTDAVEADLVAADYVWHSIYGIANAIPRMWPFRHLVLENFLHPALYAAIASGDYGRSLVQRHDPARSVNSQEGHRFAIKLDRDTDLSSLPEAALADVWSALTDPRLTKLLTRIFAPEIAKRHGPDPVRFICTMEVIEDRTGYALKPHVDVHQKLVTMLIYLAEPEAKEALGTSIYVLDRPKEATMVFKDNARLPREQFAIATTVPYRPNTALIFAPGDNTFHGVEAVAPGTQRRLVQFQVNRDYA